METNYVHKDSTTLVQDELVKNELNQIELQYNALKQRKFNELLKENQELKKQIETLEKVNKQLINKLDRYDAIVDERDELKKQKEELRDYLKARIEVCDNRLSMPFCNFEKATKERLILSQCLDKLEEMIGDDK